MDSEKIPKSRRKSQIKACNKYVKNHYDRISLNVPLGTRQRWLDEAQKRGFDGVSSFIRACVENCIQNSDF